MILTIEMYYIGMKKQRSYFDMMNKKKLFAALGGVLMIALAITSVCLLGDNSMIEKNEDESSKVESSLERIIFKQNQLGISSLVALGESLTSKLSESMNRELLFHENTKIVNSVSTNESDDDRSYLKEVSVEETEVNDAKPKYTYQDMEIVMYAQAPVNVRDLPDSSGEIIFTLSQNEEVFVSGQCNETDWYRIVVDGNKMYVSNNYLSVDLGSEEIHEYEVSENLDEKDVYVEVIEEESLLQSEPAHGSYTFENPNYDSDWFWGYQTFYYEWDSECDDWYRIIISTRTVDVNAYAEIAETVYPKPAYPGSEDGERTEEVTIWIYLGDGLA